LLAETPTAEQIFAKKNSTVPCDQRTIGVVDSGGTGEKRARLKIPNGRLTDE